MVFSLNPGAIPQLNTSNNTYVLAGHLLFKSEETQISVNSKNST